MKDEDGLIEEDNVEMKVMYTKYHKKYTIGKNTCAAEFLTVREGLTGPHQARHAGTYHVTTV